VSDPTDIKALDEYLKGDSDVSRGYRELGRDEVPPELDRRVLAAARDAVANEGTQRSRSWLRWSAPVALAASVVLVVTVVLERGPQDELVPVPAAAPAEPQQSGLIRDEDDNYAAAERKLADETSRQSAANAQSAPVFVQPVSQPPALAMPADRLPVPEPASAAVTAAKAEARPIVPPPDLALDEQASQTMAAVQAPAAAPRPEPAQRDERSARESAALSKEEADAATGAEEVSVTSTHARRGPGRTAGPRSTISSMSGAASESRPASDDERADRSDPDAWLEDIRDLRRAGKTADADREWDLFHEAFPDFQVADDDLARKKP
jgi:hypothetical protein